MNVAGSVTRDALNLCEERRGLKKKWYEAERVKEYREANKRIKKAVKAKEDWTGTQCKEIEISLNKNNSNRAYKLVKDRKACDRKVSIHSRNITNLQFVNDIERVGTRSPS